MHPVFPVSFIVIFSAASIAAQPSAAIHRYDARIDAFFNKNQRDSFLYYNDKKAKACKAADSLVLWAWVRQDGSDFLSEKEHDDTAAQQYLEAAWAERWREPNNMEEWEAVCYFQASRGWYFAQSGKLLQAVQALEAAARHYEQFRFPDFDAVASIYKPLGNCYTRLGDNDKALPVFLKALQVGGDDETMAGLYCNLGIAYWNKGAYAAAEKYHRQGLDLSKVSGLKRALLLGALAQTLLDKGETAQAARSAAVSLYLLAAEKPEGNALEYRCYSRRTAGIANIRLGKLVEAERLLAAARADALAVFGKHSRDLGKVEIAIATLSMKQGNPMLAMDAANRALSAVLPDFQARQVEKNPSATDFYEENVIFEALAAKAEAARSLYEKDGNLDWLRLALDCHDLAWQAETRLRKIYQYSTSKLDLQGSARVREVSAMQVVRILFEKTNQAIYLEKAFSIAERSKASLLRDALRDNLVRQRLADNDPKFSTLTTLRQQCAWFEKQVLLDPGNTLVVEWRGEVDKLLSQINVLEKQINAQYPSLADQHLITLSEVCAGIMTGETLVAYFVGSERIEAFIFQKNKTMDWQSFAYSPELQELAGKFLVYFDNQNAILNDPPEYLNTAFELWQKLLPVKLAASTKLTIIPDGFLNFIPFDALLISRPDAATTLRNAPYLLRSQEVCYAWSLSVLRQQQSLHSRAENEALCLVLGFANGERGLAPLLSPASERPANSDVLINAAADQQHFMAAVGGYRILHLSTHAFASVQGGQLPRLELYDQPLFLPDIYALPLQADLVTLSACQTGLGHEQSGEGVMSLARAFAQAGAACVVSSLWSVNDVSTSQLLSGFYRNLEDGQRIGQALQQTKLAYLDDPKIKATMQSPYFWAGLTMVGDDRVVNDGDWRYWWITGGVLLVVGLYFWKSQWRVMVD